MATKKVAFNFADVSTSSYVEYESSSSEDEESFKEITTSEEESLLSSDEDDNEVVQLALEAAYTCDPSYYTSIPNNPALRDSLLLLDKDLYDRDEESQGQCNIFN